MRIEILYKEKDTAPVSIPVITVDIETIDFDFRVSCRGVKHGLINIKTVNIYTSNNMTYFINFW